MYQIWRIYFDLWGHWKKKGWPTFGCKLRQSDPIVTKLKLDMSCQLLNVYTRTKFQIDISKHVEKSPENADERTDGQTDGHCHGTIRPFFKRAYKNDWTAGINVTDELNFTRFKFKMIFGWMSHIAQGPGSSLSSPYYQERSDNFECSTQWLIHVKFIITLKIVYGQKHPTGLILNIDKSDSKQVNVKPQLNLSNKVTIN